MAANPKRERQRVRCVINGKEIDVWQGYRLWDAAYEARSNTIDVIVARLRRKLEDADGSRLIHAAPGTGYVMRSAEPEDGR